MKEEGEIVRPELADNILKKIVYKANDILHNGKTASKEECLEATECVKTLLEEVYAKKPYKNN